MSGRTWVGELRRHRVIRGDVRQERHPHPCDNHRRRLGHGLRGRRSMHGYPGIHGTKVAHRSEGYYSALLWRLKLTFTVRKLNKRNTTVLAHAVTH